LAGVSKHYACVIGNVGHGNFRPPLFIKSNISAVDRVVVMKFHKNVANRWLFMTQRKIMVIVLYRLFIFIFILTCLGGPFFSGHGVQKFTTLSRFYVKL